MWVVLLMACLAPSANQVARARVLTLEGSQASSSLQLPTTDANQRQLDDDMMGDEAGPTSRQRSLASVSTKSNKAKLKGKLPPLEVPLPHQTRSPPDCYPDPVRQPPSQAWSQTSAQGPPWLTLKEELSAPPFISLPCHPLHHHQAKSFTTSSQPPTTHTQSLSTLTTSPQPLSTTP